MTQQSIIVQLIVKTGEDDKSAENRLSRFLNSWFQEDRSSAPPFEPGALLWWGIRDTQEVQIADTENISRPQGESDSRATSAFDKESRQ